MHRHICRAHSRVVVACIVALLASAVVSLPAEAHEPDYERGWHTQPVITGQAPVVQVDWSAQPTERFVDLADHQIDGQPTRPIATPITPDGQHLWVALEREPGDACTTGQTALAAIDPANTTTRIVYPGEYHQPISVTGVHRGPLDQILLTNACGTPTALARATASGDLADLRLIDGELVTGALRTVTWVNLEGPRSEGYFPTVPGVVVELEGPDGLTSVAIEVPTGHVRDSTPIETEQVVWTLDILQRAFVHRDGDSRRILIEDPLMGSHQLLALWPSPIRGIASDEGQHAIFSDDGLMLVRFPEWDQRDEQGDFVKQVVTRSPVHDVAWAPALDALAWAGEDGTWLRLANGDVRQLSALPASAIDISGDGTAIVAVEAGGYRIFTWQPAPELTPTDSISRFTPLTAEGLGPLRLGASLDTLPAAVADSITYSVADPTHVDGCGRYALADASGRTIASGFIEVTEDGPVVRSIAVTRNPNEWGINYGAPAASVIEKFGGELSTEYRKYYFDMRSWIELDDQPTTAMFTSDHQTIHEVRLGEPRWLGVDYCYGP